MEKIKKQFETQVKEATKDKVLVRLSTDGQDRDGDIVVQDFEVKGSSIPVILFHNQHSLPIGKIEKGDLQTINEGDRVSTYGWVKFASDIYEDARIVEDLVKGGFLNTVSIGFISRETEEKEDGGYIFRKNELVELSFVIVPANPDAQVISQETKKAVKKFFDACGIDGVCKEKKAVNATSAYKNVAVDIDSPWDAKSAVASVRKWASEDGSGDKDKIDWNKYKLAFAWYDEKNKENFEAYKLPFCFVKAGKLTISKRGVMTVAAVLNGAMGGVQLPQAEKEKVQKLIEWIYRNKLELDPPEWKTYENIDEILKDFSNEYKFYKDLAEKRKKVLKLYRKLLKRIRRELNLPKVEGEEKSIKQAFDFLDVLAKNVIQNKKEANPPKVKVKINPDSKLGKFLKQAATPQKD